MLKTACLIILFSVAAAAAALAQSPAIRMTKRQKAEQELKELTFNECEAVLENHEATLARIWDDKFLMYTTDGRTTPKAGARAYLRTALPQSISGVCAIEYQEIKISGDKAGMSGRMNISATAPDGTFRPVRYRFGQRLVKRGGLWRVVFLEFSPDTQ